jgi:WD40 repeat protein
MPPAVTSDGKISSSSLLLWALHHRPPPITDEKLHGEKKKADGEIDVFGKRKGGLPGQIADYEAKSRNKGAPKDHNKTLALCVCVTQCGNFGVVGYSCGRVDKYNLQSGQHRGTYHQGGHEDAVYGVAVDGLNDVLVSGGFDGMLLVWDFEKREVVHRIAVHSPVNQMVILPNLSPRHHPTLFHPNPPRPKQNV